MSNGLSRTIGPFKFTGVEPNIQAGEGTGFYFTYKGEDYIVEDWHTENGDGEDIYALDGTPVDPIDEDDEEAWEDALDEMKDRWRDAYDRIIRHAEEQAIQRTLLMAEKPVPYTPADI